ncbi:10430_t:CDS:1, partial [Dentiscutata erythropus]
MGEMKIEPDIKIESMDEDYEYLPSDPDSIQPFQVARVGHYSITGDGGCDMFVFLSFNKDDGGFLIPVQIKMRSSENMKIYDPNNVYEEGYKTLNHYLTDFDNLLSRMIFDKNENNWTTRYGIYVVNSNVHVPERYPHTKNVIMVLHDFEITVDNIREFFNRIRAKNHNREAQNIRCGYSATDTMIDKTERLILVTQTDIMERLLRECDDEKTWLEKKNMLIRVMRDTINEIRVSINDNQDDRSTSRYEREYETRMQKYDLSNTKHVTKTNTLENSKKKDAFDMKDLVKSLESSRETEKEFDMLRLLRSINNK